MSTIIKYLLGSQTTAISTGLNSFANNTNVLSSAFDNTVGQTGDGYVLCDLELVCTFGSAPTANTGCSIWFILAADGTNYEDGDSSITPARMPDVVFPVRAVTSAQRIIRRASLPHGLMKILIRNEGTGQSMASSGNTLKVRPISYQSV